MKSNEMKENVKEQGNRISKWFRKVFNRRSPKTKDTDAPASPTVPLENDPAYPYGRPVLPVDDTTWRSPGSTYGDPTVPPKKVP